MVARGPLGQQERHVDAAGPTGGSFRRVGVQRGEEDPLAVPVVRSRRYEGKGPTGWQGDGTGDIGRIRRQRDFA